MSKITEYEMQVNKQDNRWSRVQNGTGGIVK